MSFRLPIQTPPPIEFVLNSPNRDARQVDPAAHQDTESDCDPRSPAPPASDGRPSDRIDPTIRLGGVCKDIVTGLRINPVLRNLSVEFGRGITVLFGPNGAGKTTLLKLLSGRLPPTRGSVLFLKTDGAAPYVAPEGGGGLFEDLSVRENLALLSHRRLPSSLPSPAEILLSGVDLRRCVKALSRGQRQSVLLAGASLSQAMVLLLDEPTNGLDPTRRETFRSLLDHWRAAGRTVIVATHDLDLQSAADVVAYVSRGKLIGLGAALTESGEHVVRVRANGPPGAALLAAFPNAIVSGGALVLRGVRLDAISGIVANAAKLGVLELYVSPATINDMYFGASDEDISDRG